ncbi:hypothetical protein R6Q59_003089 [Mikania micrantha]
MTAFLRDLAERHEMFKSIVHGLILSPVNFAIMECPTIISSFIKDFWNTVKEEKDANGNFGNKALNPTELDDQLVEATLLRMGYKGLYPPTKKKLLHPYWRYLAHVVTQHLSGRKGGYDVLNQTLSSCTIAIAVTSGTKLSRKCTVVQQLRP